MKGFQQRPRPSAPKLVYGSIWPWKSPQSSNPKVAKSVCLATYTLKWCPGRAAALPPAAVGVGSERPAALGNSTTCDLL